MPSADKMLKAVAATVFFLITSALASEGQFEDGVLSAPQDFTIENISSTVATLRWEFADPRNVSLRDVVFLIEVRHGGWFVTVHETRRNKSPLQFSLTSLRPKTRYDVKLYAESAGFQRSRASEVSFFTPAQDTFNPSTPNAPKNALAREFISCEVLWSLSNGKENPGFSEIELCDPECHNRQVVSTSGMAVIPLKPDQPYAVKITAVLERFEVPDRFMVLGRRNRSFHFKLDHKRPGSRSILSMRTLVDSEVWEVAVDEALKLDSKSRGPVKISARFCFENPHQGARFCRGPESSGVFAKASSPSRALSVRRDRSGCLEFERDTLPKPRVHIDTYEISAKGKLGGEIYSIISETDRQHLCGPLGAGSPAKEINVTDLSRDTLEEPFSSVVETPTPTPPVYDYIFNRLSFFACISYTLLLVIIVFWICCRLIMKRRIPYFAREINGTAGPHVMNAPPSYYDANERARNNDLRANAAVRYVSGDTGNGEFGSVHLWNLTPQAWPETFREPELADDRLRYGNFK